MLNKSLKKGILIWWIIGVFFSFQFIIRLSIGILREDIMNRFSIDLMSFGSLAGVYYLGYSGMQIPVGILLDKFNFRIVTALFIIVTSIGLLTFVSNSWTTVLIGRFIIGAGSATGFLSCAKAVKVYFSEKYQSILLGVSVSFGLLGAIFGGQPMKIIFDLFGYHSTLVCMSLIGFFIAIIILLLNIGESDKHRVTEKHPPIKKILKLLINPRILFIGICGGLMVGSLEGFADVWVIPFFSQVYKFSTHDSILLGSFIFLGLVLGGPIIAWVAKYFKSINTLISIVGIATCIVFIILLAFIHMSFFASTILMLFLGILCAYQVLVFIVATSLVDNQYTGVTIAITNCLNMSCGYLFHKIISIVMYFNWDGLNINGEKVYSYKAYLISLSVIPILCCIGQFGFLYLSHKMKKQYKISL